MTHTYTSFLLTFCINSFCAKITNLVDNNPIAVPIILALYAVNRICDSQWYIVRGKYLKNFTEPESREKITFTFELWKKFCYNSVIVLKLQRVRIEL